MSDNGTSFSVHIYSSVVDCTLGSNNDRKLNVIKVTTNHVQRTQSHVFSDRDFFIVVRRRVK